MSTLKINNEETTQGIVYCELEGMIDANNFEILEAFFERYYDEGNYRFVIDIRKVEYISSAGAGVFIGAVGICQENDGNVVLVQLSTEVKEILELLGVLQLFPVVQNRTQAEEVFMRRVE